MNTHSFLRRLSIITCTTLLFISIVILFWLWTIAADLTDEIRTPVSDYYQKWLQQPEQQGMQLQKITCDYGQSQCLIALPNQKIRLAKRGLIIRKQLQSMNANLLPQGGIKGILVMLHGRGSRKEFMLPIAERFVAAGFICVIPDLPAHGEHQAKKHYFAVSLTESHFAARVLQDARKQLGKPHLPAALWAMSLGTAFANRSLAVDSQQWQAAVIISGFDELDNVLLDKLDFLPDFLAHPIHSLFTRMLQRRRGLNSKQVSPKQWAKNISRPVLVIHGDQDKLIHQPRGHALFSAYRSKDKTWVSVTKGNHHNILITTMPLYATMGEWLLRYFNTASPR